MIWKAVRFAVQVAMVLAFAVVIAEGQTRKSSTPATSFSEPAPTQQPLMTEYKGVRIGMTADEVHAKLGNGTKIDNQEFFFVSDRETAQVGFDAANKVTTISVDYIEGVGAPDYRTVVGPDINVKPDGSMYKMVRYDKLGFWVSYNRTPNSTVLMVSITIQKQI